MEYKYILRPYYGLVEIESIEIFMDEKADTCYKINGYSDYYRFNYYPKGDGFIYVEDFLAESAHFLLKDFDSLYKLVDKFINDFNNNKK